MKDKIFHIFKPIDLTTGKPWKVMLSFALPILIATILGNAFSLINSLVLKINVGGDSVTAINACSALSSMLFNFAYGCSSGFAISAANKKGAKDTLGLTKVYHSSLFLSLILSSLISIVGLCFYKDLLVLLNINERYLIKASAYFQIILFAFPFMMLTNFLANFTRSIGNSFVPLLLSFITALFNIAFAFLFTSVFKFDTRGVAFATLISNGLTAMLYFVYLHKKHPELNVNKSNLSIDKRNIFDLLKLGLPLGFQWSILFIGSFVLSSQLNLFGDGAATKAVSCYSHLEVYLTIPLQVVSQTLLSFVGQNFGAKDKDRIFKGIKTALVIDGIAYMLILIAGYILTPFTPYIFLPAEELTGNFGAKIIYYCTTYLHVLVPCLIFQAIVTFSRSCLQGIKKTFIPFLSGVGELFARIAISLLLPSLINPSNPYSDESFVGICFSTPFAWVISSLIMGGSVIYIFYIRKLKQLDTEIVIN